MPGPAQHLKELDMVEFKKKVASFKAAMKRAVPFLTCHRAVYAGLAACHGSGCVVTQKPELYGPMAILYLVLVFRG